MRYEGVYKDIDFMVINHHKINDNIIIIIIIDNKSMVCCLHPIDKNISYVMENDNLFSICKEIFLNFVSSQYVRYIAD